MFKLAKKDQISKEKIFWLPALNLKDIVTFNTTVTLTKSWTWFLLKTVATFVCKVGLIWLKGVFLPELFRTQT